MNPDRQLNPPEPSARDLLDGEAWTERRANAEIVAMSELLQGRGEFWHDVREPIYNAVRDALRDGCGPELFRLRVLAAVASEGMKYAAAVAEETL